MHWNPDKEDNIEKQKTMAIDWGRARERETSYVNNHFDNRKLFVAATKWTKKEEKQVTFKWNKSEYNIFLYFYAESISVGAWRVTISVLLRFAFSASFFENRFLFSFFS